MNIRDLCVLTVLISILAGVAAFRSSYGDIPADLRDGMADDPQPQDISIPFLGKGKGDIPDTKGPVRVDESADGVPVKKIGCYFNGARSGKQAPLLIYYRGWLNKTNCPGCGLSGGKITGEYNILRSARSALEFYGLKRVALKKGLVVLVTGSSNIAVAQADIANLQRELGYVFPRVYVAAHSGGYAGLAASMGSLDRVDGIVLLDPFYSDFSSKIRPKTQGGAACGGFYTPHNEARYKNNFSGLKCAVELKSSPGSHERQVEPCLEKNLP